MSSTTILTSLYSDRRLNPIDTHWLTYAVTRSADLIALLLVAASYACVIHFHHGQLERGNALRVASCVLLFYSVFVFGGLSPEFPLNGIVEFQKTLRGAVRGLLIFIAAVLAMGQDPVIPRTTLALAWLLTSISVPVCRYLTRLCCSSRSWWGIPTVILGERSVGMRILNELRSNPQVGLRPVATHFDLAVDKNTSSSAIDQTADTELSESLPYPYIQRDCYAIIAAPFEQFHTVRALVSPDGDCYRRIMVIPDQSGLTSLAVRTKDIQGVLGLEINHGRVNGLSEIMKRSVDILVSAFAGLLTLPILLVIAVAVKASSHGSILFWQRRVGRGGREFRLWKFRTMVVNAEAVLEQHLRDSASLREEWERDHKLREDPRITAIGRFLRRTSLDELPQLWNILCGEMSLVGPRPISHAEVGRYGSIFDQYRKVSPGLTGLWQISGRNNTTYERRVQLDDYYVKNWSHSLDLYILFRTIRTLLLAEGAY